MSMKRLLILPLLALAFTACVKESIGDIPLKSAPSDKIYYASEKAAKGRLIVKVDAPTEVFTIEGMELDIEPLFAGKADDKAETVYEISDLCYHVLVLMVQMGISIDDIKRELASRHVIDHKVKQEKMTK